MKWYNKPITWKGYGILCLVSLLLVMVNAAAMLFKPDVFLRPWERLTGWIFDKIEDHYV